MTTYYLFSIATSGLLKKNIINDEFEKVRIVNLPSSMILTILFCFNPSNTLRLSTRPYIGFSRTLNLLQSCNPGSHSLGRYWVERIQTSCTRRDSPSNLLGPQNRSYVHLVSPSISLMCVKVCQVLLYFIQCL